MYNKGDILIFLKNSTYQTKYQNMKVNLKGFLKILRTT